MAEPGPGTYAWESEFDRFNKLSQQKKSGKLKPLQQWHSTIVSPKANIEPKEKKAESQSPAKKSQQQSPPQVQAPVAQGKSPAPQPQPEPQKKQ